MCVYSVHGMQRTTGAIQLPKGLASQRNNGTSREPPALLFCQSQCSTQQSRYWCGVRTKDECPSQNADCDMSKAWSLRKCLHVREVNTSTLEETHFLGVLWTAGTQTWNVTWGVNNTPITFKLDNVTV